MTEVSGRLVTRCPGCGEPQLLVVGFKCVHCGGKSRQAKRLFYKTMTDAIMRYGHYHKDGVGRVYVDVCPTCSIPSLVPTEFCCSGCASTFDKASAVVTWE